MSRRKRKSAAPPSRLPTLTAEIIMREAALLEPRRRAADRADAQLLAEQLTSDDPT